jgi:hypothetical protein
VDASNELPHKVDEGLSYSTIRETVFSALNTCAHELLGMYRVRIDRLGIRCVERMSY